MPNGTKTNGVVSTDVEPSPTGGTKQSANTAASPEPLPRANTMADRTGRAHNVMPKYHKFIKVVQTAGGSHKNDLRILWTTGLRKRAARTYAPARRTGSGRETKIAPANVVGLHYTGRNSKTGTMA